MLLCFWLKVPRVAVLATSMLIAGGALLPTVALAQTPAVAPVAPSVRSLPDFTDLVDMVGPSVVNIRTLERAKAETGAAPDEQMLEFFRRFGIPIPPGAIPRGPRPERGLRRSAAARRWFGLHPERRWSDHDQRPCG